MARDVKQTPVNENQMVNVGYHDDEISLIDLWLVLARRKWIVVSVFVFVVLAGGVFSLIKEAQYKYTSSIEIGTQDEKLFQNSGTVLAKLNDGYIPMVGQELYQKEDDKPVVNINAKASKESHIIVLESKGSERNADWHQTVHKAIVGKLTADHVSLYNTQEFEFETQKIKQGNEIERLNEKGRQLNIDLKRLDEKKVLYQNRLVEYEKSDSRLQKTKLEILAKGQQDMSAIGLMMVDSELSKLYNQKSELREFLTLKLPAERESIIRQLSENDMGIKEKTMAIESIDLQLKAMNPTKALVVALQSRSSVGAGAMVMLVLSAVLGLMAGIFMAFFAEFLVKAKQQMRTVEHENAGEISDQGDVMSMPPRIVKGI